MKTMTVIQRAINQTSRTSRTSRTRIVVIKTKKTEKMMTLRITVG